MAAEETTSTQTESFKYRNQASHYANDKNALISILDSLKTTTEEVETMLEGSDRTAQNDYFTNKIEEGNTNIATDIAEIKAKLESVSASLTSRAQVLDNEENTAAATGGSTGEGQ